MNGDLSLATGRTSAHLLLACRLMIMLCAAAPAVSAAAPQVSAKVLWTGVYGNGDVYVAFDTAINEPGCPSMRIDVPASLPSAKQILAIAQLALASSRTVVLAAEGCMAGSPTLGNGWSTYFYLLGP